MDQFEFSYERSLFSGYHGMRLWRGNTKKYARDLLEKAHGVGSSVTEKQTELPSLLHQASFDWRSVASRRWALAFKISLFPPAFTALTLPSFING
jgi:hypothetical protein